MLTLAGGRVRERVLRRVALVGLLTLASASLAACGSSGADSLPKSAAPVGRILDASAAKPQLGIEGDTIAATLKDGHVLITVVGPDVPSQGLSPPPPTTAATFTVTLKHPEGVVPIAAADFEILDGAGQIHEPQLVVGTTPAPATAPVGQTSSFQLTTVLATGPGTLRWAPEGSPIASWDFTVEVD